MRPITFTEAIAVFLFASWFMLSVAGQVRSGRWQRFRRWDVLGFIPFWAMFSGSPEWCDYYILRRDRISSGIVTPWTRLFPMPDRRWFHVVVNPTKFVLKVVHYIVRGLRKSTSHSGNLPYLMVLNAVSHAPRMAGEATQFLILRQDVSANHLSDTVVLSHFHRL